MRLGQLCKLTERWVSNFRRQSAGLRRRRRLDIELLESRQLLSTINWTNRGSAQNDTDGFGAAYGANAARARTIIDEALSDWQKIIANFNYANVGTAGNAPQANTFSLSISAQNLLGLNGQTSNFQIDDEDKPYQATIQLDDDAAGSNWYFDATPTDNAEFTTLTTRFQANRTGTTVDFYRTAAHEIGHAMGILYSTRLAINNFLSAAGTDQVDNVSALYLFTGATVTATLTRNGGGHLYEGPVDPLFPNVPITLNDLLNGGRTVPNATTRRLISDLDASILRDAYGYTINMPSTVETFLCNYNSSTSELTLNGDPLVGGDTISIDPQGAWTTVTVDDVSESYLTLLVSQITVRSGAGNDTINIQSVADNMPVVVYAGTGNDRINVTPGNQNLDNLLDPVTVNGESGTDTLTLNDQNNNFGDTFTFNFSSVSRQHASSVTYGTLENITLHAGSGSSIFIIESTAASTALTINAGSGNDTFDLAPRTGAFNLGGGNLNVITKAVTLNGQIGIDALILNDQNNAGNDTFTVTSSTVKRTGTATMTYRTMESVRINAGAGHSIFDVDSTTSTAPVSIYAGGGDDTFNLARTAMTLTNLRGGLSLYGEAGTDAVVVYDQNNAGNDTFTVTNAAVSRTNVPGAAYDHTLERLTIHAGGGGNQFNIESVRSGVPLVINAGGGNDALRFSPTAGRLVDVSADVTINGDNGTDSVVLNDASEAASYTYTVTGNTFDRGAFPLLTFGTVESMQVNAGTGDDTIDASAAVIKCQLYGGSGNDNLLGGSLDDLLVGGPGNDTASGGAGIDVWMLGGTQLADRFDVVPNGQGSLRATRKLVGDKVFAETDTFLYDAADLVWLVSLGGDDQIAVDPAITIGGTIDGGNGFDTCTAPKHWTKLNCEA